MAEIVTTAGRKFNAGEGESILDAAIRHGISFEYSCQTGRCGTCKARLLEGSAMALRDESGLASSERSSGWILTCVRSACSDVLVDIADLGDFRILATRTLPCRIHELERLSEDVLKVMLRLPPNTGFEYYPGQYIDILGPAGLRRSYSIANARCTGGQLELHVRRVANGAMSDYWFAAAKTGDLLRLRGPYGTCFLREVAGRDLVFLATGTGIAPIKAMLEGLASGDSTSQPRTISLYWGGRSSQDLYWNPEAAGIECRFVPVLSRAAASWRGARGHVQDVLLREQAVIGDAIVYACGSDAMIRAARQELVDAGLPERSYRSDAFVSSEGILK